MTSRLAPDTATTATRQLQAALWDMDGTLMDSEVHWLAAQSAVLARFDLPPLTAKDEESLVGVAVEDVATIFQARGVPLSAAEIVDQVVDDVVARVSAGAVWRPGALELLEEFSQLQIPMAVVTNSSRALVDAMLAQLPGQYFSAFITRDRVTNPKPHPEPYQLAAADLGVDPAACVAFEDSPTGVASAVAAGCAVVAIPHGATVAESDSYHVRTTLAGLRVADLERLVSARTDTTT